MSTLPVTRLDLVQGDTGKWNVVITDESTGVPLILTGCTLRMAIYYRTPAPATADDGSAEVVLTSDSGISITNASAGAVTITLPAVASALLTPDYHVFDVLMTNAVGETYTVASGFLNITPAITHATGEAGADFSNDFSNDFSGGGS